MTDYTIDSVALKGGTLTCTLYSEDSGITVPAGVKLWKIGAFTERTEIAPNKIELGNVEVSFVDVVDETYTRGFWYYVFAEYVGLYKTPEMLFTLDEGSGATFLFWGRIDPTTTKFTHPDTQSGTPKLCTVMFVSALKCIEDIPFATLIDDLLDNRCENDERLNSRPNLTLSRVGPDDGVTYGYRVAARTAYGEQIPCNESTISGPATLDGSNYIQISWTAITGATEYAVYRSTGGGSQGYLGKTGSTSYNDQGGSAAAGYKTSNRKFVKVTNILNAIVALAYDQAYASDTVDALNYEIKFGTASVFDAYILLYKNYGTNDSPTMGLSEYFDSASDKYIGNRYSNVLEWIGSVLKAFLCVPRHLYSMSGSRHQLELLSRGKIGGIVNVTPTGAPLSWETVVDNPSRPNSVIVFRNEEQDNNNYKVGGNGVDYDLSIGLDFLVQETPVTYKFVTYTMNDYEKIYGSTSTSLGLKFDEQTTVSYYSYSVGNWVSVTSDFRTQEAVAKYWFDRFPATKRLLQRTYAGLKGNNGTTTTQANVQLLRRSQVDDGAGEVTFDMYSVEKDVVANKLTLTLIEE